eukprot:PLAT5569.1.p2 GENE.PLAT5569.1~~PLAT5569.1.p2  ORF type:complete len:185 (-),score=85.07 PLAT5569.1:55-609(-)
MLACGHDGCDELLPMDSIEEHMLAACRHRPRPCKFCSLPLLPQHEREHQRVCPGWPMLCQQGCSAGGIPRAAMAEHIAEVCPLTYVACPYAVHGCDFRDSRAAMAEHEAAAAVEHLAMVGGQLAHALTGLAEQRDIIRAQQRMLHEQGELIEQLRAAVAAAGGGVGRAAGSADADSHVRAGSLF